MNQGFCEAEPELLQLSSAALGGVRGAETQPQPFLVDGRSLGIRVRVVFDTQGGGWALGA